MKTTNSIVFAVFAAIFLCSIVFRTDCTNTYGEFTHLRSANIIEVKTASQQGAKAAAVSDQKESAIKGFGNLSSDDFTEKELMQKDPHQYVGVYSILKKNTKR